MYTLDCSVLCGYQFSVTPLLSVFSIHVRAVWQFAFANFALDVLKADHIVLFV
jgi:hypothetical protein